LWKNNYTITSDKCTLHSTLEKYNVQKYNV